MAAAAFPKVEPMGPAVSQPPRAMLSLDRQRLVEDSERRKRWKNILIIVICAATFLLFIGITTVEIEVPRHASGDSSAFLVFFFLFIVGVFYFYYKKPSLDFPSVQYYSATTSQPRRSWTSFLNAVQDAPPTYAEALRQAPASTGQHTVVVNVPGEPPSTHLQTHSAGHQGSNLSHVSPTLVQDATVSRQQLPQTETIPVAPNVEQGPNPSLLTPVRITSEDLLAACSSGTIVISEAATEPNSSASGQSGPVAQGPNGQDPIKTESSSVAVPIHQTPRPNETMVEIPLDSEPTVKPRK